MANEKRLIDANALKDALRTNEGAKALGHSIYKLFAVDEIIDQMPTVDAVEVVHGRWINKTKEIYGMVDERNDCSNCGQVYWFACPDFNYCPNCGAKMDGDGNG